MNGKDIMSPTGRFADRELPEEHRIGRIHRANEVVGVGDIITMDFAAIEARAMAMFAAMGTDCGTTGISFGRDYVDISDMEYSPRRMLERIEIKLKQPEPERHPWVDRAEHRRMKRSKKKRLWRP